MFESVNARTDARTQARTPALLPSFKLNLCASRTGIPMILKLGMQHQGLELCKVCINDDPGMAMIYFAEMSNSVAYAFEWRKLLVI